MGRKEQRDETRARLLDVARRHFEARGFEQTQLREVAAEAEVALGTIFVHFADKRDLLSASFFDSLAESIARAETLEVPGFLPWLDALTAAYLDDYAARPALSRVLVREALLGEPPWAERFGALIARSADSVVVRFQKEQEAGRISGRADARVFAAAFVSFFTFALIAWVQGTHPQPRALVSVLVRQHLEGVST